MARPDKPQVVIVGAGFGGLSAAKAVAGKEVDVTLIDRRNYHLFQPLLYQVATAALSPAEIAAPIRHVLRHHRNITVFMDEVQGIDRAQRQVVTKAGRTQPYDYLILATGAQHSYFGKDEWAEYAPGLKSIDDAHNLRRQILTAFERAEMEPHPAAREALLTFVIVGAGPTGVELAGAIAELARHSLTTDFRHITPQCARILLVEAGPRVLPAFDETLAARAAADLARMGVEVRANTRVTDVAKGSVRLGDADLSVETVVWAAGVQASPAGRWLDVETDCSGRVSVDGSMRIAGEERVFAVGDTGAHVPDGAERPLPGVAPVAKQMGVHAARVILAEAGLRPDPGPFRYLDFGNMATIGRNKAIADLNGWKISGFMAWLLWGMAHVYFLIGFRSRFVVALNWFWSYLTWQRGVRLIFNTQN